MADQSAPYDSFCDALGHRFEDQSLLTLALTHRSWCAEHPTSTSNERLEFLGDAVLDLAMTEVLYRNRPDEAEGSLAKARAEVVSAPSLAALARHLDVGPLLLLGNGEDQSGGRDKDSILADAVEAVFGAVYLDSGWDDARRVVQRLLAGAAAEAQLAPGKRDYKTRLQEVAASRGLASPMYRIETSGPDHDLSFSAIVDIGPVSASGHGPSKKGAEQDAARRALERFERAPEHGRIAAKINDEEAEGHGTG